MVIIIIVITGICCVQEIAVIIVKQSINALIIATVIIGSTRSITVYIICIQTNRCCIERCNRNLVKTVLQQCSCINKFLQWSFIYCNYCRIERVICSLQFFLGFCTDIICSIVRNNSTGINQFVICICSHINRQVRRCVPVADSDSLASSHFKVAHCKELVTVVRAMIMRILNHKAYIAVSLAVCYLSRLICCCHIGECCYLLKVHAVVTTLNKHHQWCIAGVTDSGSITELE